MTLAQLRAAKRREGRGDVGMIGWKLFLVDPQGVAKAFFRAHEVRTIEANVREAHQIMSDERMARTTRDTVVLQHLTQDLLGAIEISGASQVTPVVGHRVQ